jgi:hypothetical protein
VNIDLLGESYKFAHLAHIARKGDPGLSPGTEFEGFASAVLTTANLPIQGKNKAFNSSPGDHSVKPCNMHIIRTLSLVEEMMALADQGDADREDNGCGILYGVLRDSAYKLKKLAEDERQNHIIKGWWHEKP